MEVERKRLTRALLGGEKDKWRLTAMHGGEEEKGRNFSRKKD